MKSALDPGPHRAPKSRIRRRVRLALLAVVIAIPCLLGGWSSTRQAGPAFRDLPTETVRRDHFRKVISITGGEIRTANPAVVSNECRASRRRIVELVPEGTWVGTGDVVCVLDSSELVDRLNSQRILLLKARAALANAEAQLEIRKLTNARRLSQSQLKLELSGSQLEEYRQSSSINTDQNLQDQVRLAQERLNLARENLSITQGGAAHGYRSLNELAGARSGFQSADRAMDLAETNLNLSRSYRHPRMLIELETEAELAAEELKRTQLSNELATASANVTWWQMQQRVATLENQVRDLEAAIDACTLRASASGQLLYCHHRDEGRLIEVGGLVYYQQDIVRIADRSELVMAGRVSDAVVHELSPGLPVRVVVDSPEQRSVHGVLRWIAPIPSPGSWFQPGELYHNVQILLQDPQDVLDSLTLGASSSAEIIVDDRTDVLQIPIRSVFSRQKHKHVICRTTDGLSLHEVCLGNYNDDVAEISSGLQAGDIVIVGDQQTLRSLAESLL